MSKKHVQQRTSHPYTLTPKGEQLLREDGFGTQPKLIAQALHRKGQATRQELAEAIKSKVETRQPVARVVSFYLTTWKSQGIVKAAKQKAKKTPKAEKAQQAVAAVA
jgi:hypothetical protein